MAIAILGFPSSIAIFCPIGFVGPLASAAEPTPADVLARLHPKDQQLDNARLDVIRFEQWNLKAFPVIVRPIETRSVSRETLVVRGRDVTVFWGIDPKPSEQAADQSFRTAFQKSSTVGGVSRRFSRTEESGRSDSTLEIEPGDPVTLNQEHAMFVEFCLGFGFGKRIRTIDRIEPAGGLLKVEGSIQIWWEDESTCQLTLDDHYLVREAIIEANVKGNRTRLEVHTKETVAAQGVELAKRGLFKRIALPDAPVEYRSVQQEFKIRFEAVHPNLSDADYQELIAMPHELGTRVNDHIKNETYVVGEPPQPSGPASAKL